MGKKYSRSDLILDVYAAHEGVSKAIVESIIKKSFSLVADAVRMGSTVELREFATFKPIERKARLGRNLHTGEPIQIPAKKACSVKSKFKLNDD